MVASKGAPVTVVAMKRPRKRYEKEPQTLTQKTVAPKATGFEKLNLPMKNPTILSKAGVNEMARAMRAGRRRFPTEA